MYATQREIAENAVKQAQRELRNAETALAAIPKEEVVARPGDVVVGRESGVKYVVVSQKAYARKGGGPTNFPKVNPNIQSIEGSDVSWFQKDGKSIDRYEDDTC